MTLSFMLPLSLGLVRRGTNKVRSVNWDVRLSSGSFPMLSSFI